MTRLENQIDAVEQKLDDLNKKNKTPEIVEEIERVKADELQPLLVRLHKRNHYRHHDLLGMLLGGLS